MRALRRLAGLLALALIALAPSSAPDALPGPRNALLTARAGGWSPRQLAPLCFWDVAQPGRVFTDTAGTSLATVDGDSVALLRDAYGASACDLSQATATKRPVLRISGVRRWLDFDGVDDGLSTASTIALPIENTIMLATAGDTVVANRVLLEHGDNADGTSGGWRISRGVTRSHLVRDTAIYYQESTSGTWGAGLAVLGWRYSAGVFTREKDGASVAMSAAVGTVQGSRITTQRLYMGGRTNTSLIPTFSFYAGGVLPASVGFNARLRTWLAAKQGRTL